MSDNKSATEKAKDMVNQTADDAKYLADKCDSFQCFLFLFVFFFFFFFFFLSVFVLL